MARKAGIDIEIDRLTNSIVNTISGDILVIEFQKVSNKEIKRKDWIFNWQSELAVARNEVYKMTIKDNPTIIQGLISFRFDNGFVFINVVENAKFNRGSGKLYEGVGGNLFAYACKRSLEAGLEGFVVFEAKTALIGYYQKALGAESLGGQRMVISDKTSLKLINQYFKK